MKKIVKYMWLSSVLFTTVSCGRDMVGVETLDNGRLEGETFIHNDAVARAAAVGIYNAMQSRYVYGGEMHFFEGLFADDFIHTGTYPEFAEAGASNFLDINLSLRRIFGGHYAVIRTCNIIIDQVETRPVPETAITEPVKKQVLGEAYAGRALMHFNLTRLFGDVAYVTTPVYKADEVITPARDSQHLVYESIVKDLKKSVEFFKQNDHKSKTFLNLDAAQVLLAKVYMEMKLFDEAKLLLESIKGYSLAPSYPTLFSVSGSPEEDIFKINFTNTDGGKQASFSIPLLWEELEKSL
ncbi:RagB/SusD family nutrient uptake outer membrane protein [Chryseobacterium sp. 1B4]